MFTKSKLPLTEAQKSEVIIEYLTDKVALYSTTEPDSAPDRHFQTLLRIEQTKLKMLTKKKSRKKK